METKHNDLTEIIDLMSSSDESEEVANTIQLVPSVHVVDDEVQVDTLSQDDDGPTSAKRTRGDGYNDEARSEASGNSVKQYQKKKRPSYDGNMRNEHDNESANDDGKPKATLSRDSDAITSVTSCMIGADELLSTSNHNRSVSDNTELSSSATSQLKTVAKESSLNQNFTSNQHQHPCRIDIYRKDGDDGILTRGLTPIIQGIGISPDNNNNNIIGTLKLTATYVKKSMTKNGTNEIRTKQHSANASSTLLISKGELVHIQQKDKWSCGYRNLQMLLSVILPNVPSYHPIHGLISHPAQGGKIIIPSVKQLQYIIEQSWKHGFDNQGKLHFHSHMTGKTGHAAQIGAVEISSILSFLYIDSTILQFIACYESRSLLGPFVWSYFNKLPFGSDGSCYYCKGDDICSSLDTSYEILQYVSMSSMSTRSSISSAQIISGHPFMDNHDENEQGHDECCCDHPLLPLYLQWEGHSVSCVGVEKIEREIGDNSHEYNLLIYDPMKSGATLKEHLKEATGTTIGMKENLLRLSTHDLIRKDCQIVLCSLKPLSDNSRQTRAIVTNSNVITASQDHVERTLQSL